MADVSIKYNNAEIATLSSSGTKTVKTNGKRCIDDIVVVYDKPEGTCGSSSGIEHVYGGEGRHTENLVWSKPDEWHTVVNGIDYDEDIEQITLGSNDDVVYYLLDNRDENAFFAIRLYLTASTDYANVSFGHVKNGVYTEFENVGNFKHNTYCRLWLDDYDYDFIVARVTPVSSHLQGVTCEGWASTTEHPYSIGYNYNSILMRYGRLPYCQYISFGSYYAESDNIIDLATSLTNMPIYLSSVYTGCRNLQKWRNTGWNIVNNYVTTFASFMNGCYRLRDVPNPINVDGWVSDKTINITNAFNVCETIYAISCRNWNLSNVTTAYNCFRGMKYLEYIFGMETWIGGQKLTDFSAVYADCQSLQSDIDLTGLTLSSGTLTTLNSTFSACRGVRIIKFPDLNLTNCKSFNKMFGDNFSLIEIIHGTITPPSQTLDDVDLSSMFSGCLSLTHIDFLKDWKLLNPSLYNTFNYAYNIYSTDDIELGDFSVTYTKTKSMHGIFNTCLNIKKIDMSWNDTSYDSGNYGTTSLINGCYSLIELYPPISLKPVAFSISNSPRLNKASIVRVLNALPTTSTSLKLTLGAPLLKRLSTEDIAIATEKGWTLG